MALDFSFLQAATDTSDLTTYTFSSQSLGTADADRYIIVGVIARKAGAATTIDSVTIGGVTATELLEQSNSDSNSNIAGLYIANVPTGTTGDVVVTFGAGMVRCAIGMWRAVGIDSPTPTDSSASTASDPTYNIDVDAGGFAVGMAISNSATTTSWTGITEDFDGTLESFVTYTGASLEFASAQTDLTLTADFASSGSTPIGVFASWAEAVGAITINVSDTITITDYWPGYDAEPITVTDEPTVEIQTPSGALTINVSDDITITESSDVRLTSYINVSDSITITEDTPVSLRSSVNVSDDITMTDSTTVVIPVSINVNDTITVTENSTVLRKLHINASDSITVTDSGITIRRSPLRINVSDTITVTENVTVVKMRTPSVSDSITITESSTVLTILNINTSDTITITENSSTDVVIYVDQYDTITMEDVLPEYHPEEITVTDVVVDVELSNADLRTINVSDDITITESQTVLINELVPSVSDDITISENSTITLVVEPDNIDVNDTINISESVSVVLGSNINVSDDITITDAPTTIIASHINVNDSITITEFVTISGELNINVSDTITITEAITLLLIVNIDIYDDITVTDDVTLDRGGPREISVFDDIIITEYNKFKYGGAWYSGNAPDWKTKDAQDWYNEDPKNWKNKSNPNWYNKNVPNWKAEENREP